MKFASVTERLQGLGGAKWALHTRARALKRAGADIIELTIGEPDTPPDDTLIETACAAIRDGRTGYADGQGEAGLRAALAARASQMSGRPIGAGQVLCLPGTQTALYAALMAVAEAGDEVIVGDPMYATYEAVVRATGAAMVPVALRADKGFRLAAGDVERALTPRTRAILVTHPHNPTGAVLREADMQALGALARRHGLWIIADEVYEELVFDGVDYRSFLSCAPFADQVVSVSSISKAHAAPGFRSGWCIGPDRFVEAALPLAEAMLFGNQPFIADMTERAVRDGSAVAPGMRRRFARRALRLAQRLEAETGLRVHRPEAGMFAMIDVRATGLTGLAYAEDLLERQGVAVMPGSSFGQSLAGWVRVALTAEDAALELACDRIIAHFARQKEVTA